MIDWKEDLTKEEFEAALKEERDRTASGITSRFEKKYVKKENLDSIVSENEILKNEISDLKLTPKIKEHFLQQGGKQEAFKDFFNTNKNNFIDKEDKEIKSFINEQKKVRQYMFNESNGNISGELNKGGDKVVKASSTKEAYNQMMKKILNKK